MDLSMRLDILEDALMSLESAADTLHELPDYDAMVDTIKGFANIVREDLDEDTKAYNEWFEMSQRSILRDYYKDLI